MMRRRILTVCAVVAILALMLLLLYLWEKHYMRGDELPEDDTEDYLWLYKKDIQEIIENQMVARYCYSKGGVKHTIPGDEVIKQAVELLSDEARYNHILAEQDTQRKVENK
jgi:hypothetical protein